MVDENTVNLISGILVSNNTVRNRIQDLSHDVKNTTVSRISQTKFSLQLGEFTDIAGSSVLITFLRYELSSSFHKDILFCKPFPFSTIKNEIFSILDFSLKTRYYGKISLMCAQMAQMAWLVMCLASLQDQRSFKKLNECSLCMILTFSYYEKIASFAIAGTG